MASYLSSKQNLLTDLITVLQKVPVPIVAQFWFFCDKVDCQSIIGRILQQLIDWLSDSQFPTLVNMICM